MGTEHHGPAGPFGEKILWAVAPAAMTAMDVAAARYCPPDEPLPVLEEGTQGLAIVLTQARLWAILQADCEGCAAGFAASCAAVARMPGAVAVHIDLSGCSFSAAIGRDGPASPRGGHDVN